jgi:pyruvate kinase
MRGAKILATIGPASRDPETIEQLIAAGMNAVRINMSHGTYADHLESIGNVRAAAEKLGQPVAILVDLSGPKIRTGELENAEAVWLADGATFIITSRAMHGTAAKVSTNFTELPKIIQPGARILLDDGALRLEAVDADDENVVCRVVRGGWLSERKGINLPNTPLPIPSLTQKDRADLEWASGQNVDYVALSFVRQAADCTEVRELIKRLNRRDSGRALLVAKIEKAEAIENLAEIIDAADGVMVARGDLGVETSVELVPVYQKRIIQEAVANDKFVITATQMLQTMIDNSFPTRAEASDVANAVWDGTDAVMLSAETATGKYPVQAVKTMARIIDSAETGKPKYLKKMIKLSQNPTGRTSQALCKAAAYAAQEMKVEKIAVFTESGLMARRLSSFRSGLQTFALTTSEEARNQLALIWGVRPFYHEDLNAAGAAQKVGEMTMMDLLNTGVNTTEEMLETGEKTLLEAGVVKPGETIIIMAGRLSGLGLSSSVMVWTISGPGARR